MLQKLTDENIMTVFVTGNCMSDLQPMDLSVKKPLKNSMKNEFISWYAKVLQQKWIKESKFKQLKYISTHEYMQLNL